MFDDDVMKHLTRAPPGHHKLLSSAALKTSTLLNNGIARLFAFLFYKKKLFKLIIEPVTQLI